MAMPAVTLAISSVVLLALVFGLGRLKHARFDILDVYAFMIGLYFGVYGLADAFFGNNFYHNPTIILVTYLHVCLVVIALYGSMNLIPLRIRKAAQFDILMRHFSTVNANALMFFVAISLGVDAYIFSSFGLLTYVGEELSQLQVSVPSWVGPLKNLNWNIRFCLLILLINLLMFKKVKFFSIYGVVVIPLVGLQFVEGRRALIELMTVCFILWSIYRNTSPYMIRRGFAVLPLLLIFLLASNVFQNYRHSVFTITALSTGTIDAKPVSEAAMDFEATMTNLSERTAMWRLNYEIFENQVRDPTNVHAGTMIWRQFLNAIPSILQADKQVVGTEELISQIYDMDSLKAVSGYDDFPTNDLSSYQADFGVLSIFIIPLVFLTILCISYLSFKRIDSKLFSSVIILLCLQYLIKIENGYDLPILVRNIFLLFFFYSALAFLIACLPRKRLYNHHRPT